MLLSITDADYSLIRNLVYEHSRIALGPNKQEMVANRVRKRLRHLGMDNYSEYCDYLQTTEGQSELQELIDAISTNYTTFFRDQKHFDFLRSEILQKLERTPKETTIFRVWSAACSSGEEPYSLAICLADYFSKQVSWNWELHASDISTRMLNAAANGVYELSQVRLPNPEWLKRYFQRGVNEYEGCCRVKPELRHKIQFHHLNLLQTSYPLPPGLHVIFCRNVMIYFDRQTQERLVRKLTDYLLPGGYFFIGASESLIGISHSLRYVRPSIYQKVK